MRTSAVSTVKKSQPTTLSACAHRSSRQIGPSAPAPITRFVRRYPLLVAILAAGVLTSACGASGPSAGAVSGRAVFLRAGCGSCHTLAGAGTHGRFGPDFDTSELLSASQLRASLTEGANGMPSFRGRLNDAQLSALADFLYKQTHRTPDAQTRRRPGATP